MYEVLSQNAVSFTHDTYVVEKGPTHSTKNSLAFFDVWKTNIPKESLLFFKKGEINGKTYKLVNVYRIDNKKMMIRLLFGGWPFQVKLTTQKGMH